MYRLCGYLPCYVRECRYEFINKVESVYSIGWLFDIRNICCRRNTKSKNQNCFQTCNRIS